MFYRSHVQIFQKYPFTFCNPASHNLIPNIKTFLLYLSKKKLQYRNIAKLWIWCIEASFFYLDAFQGSLVSHGSSDFGQP
jgi:hypothetical protein